MTAHFDFPVAERRALAESERRTAAKAFARRHGVRLPAYFDGRPWTLKVDTLIDDYLYDHPAARALLEQFGEIDGKWCVSAD